MQNNILGNRIKYLREEYKLNQLEFSKVLNISNTTLSQYEAGNRIPSDEIKAKIADYFDVSVDYLLGRTDERIPVKNDDEWPTDVKIMMRDARKLTARQKEIVKRLIKDLINEE